MAASTSASEAYFFLKVMVRSPSTTMFNALESRYASPNAPVGS